MKLSLTSWSFPSCTLEEAAGISKVLGINALDVGLFYRSALNRDQMQSDPKAVAQHVKALGVDLPNYYHLFGTDMVDRNLANTESVQQNCKDFEQVVAFCTEAGIGTVFILPGMIGAGQSRRQAQDASIESLNALIDVAKGSGITLTIEPHVHSILESPDDVLRHIESVDDLKLTLDYAHFASIGYRQSDIDALAPHAAHIHLRQARPGALQTKMGDGTINMMAQFGSLRDAGFKGSLAIEYVHQDYMGTIYEDVLTETITMRDLFRQWTSKT